jgi:hypothetical protein
MAGRDAEWWAEFEAAQPELRRAMYETKKARDNLKIAKGLGLDDSALMPYRDQVRALTLRESAIRDALKAECDAEKPEHVEPIDLGLHI